MNGLTQQPTTNKTVTVGTSSILISQKQKRKTIYIRNTSTTAQVITIALDNFSAAVANQGIVLAPGEYFSDSNSEGYKCWHGDIKAISTAAAGTLAIMEAYEDGI
jgi:hypothetical protein